MKKDMTIEDLAIIIQQSLSGMESRMATKDDLNDLRNGLRGEINSLREEMNDRFDRIEHILYRGHDNRIERLEDQMLQVKNILGKKLT